MYVQDKFKIQIRVSETSVGSFQFVLLHPQDLFRNFFALKFENVCRNFENSKDWVIRFTQRSIPSEKYFFCQVADFIIFFIRRIFFFVNDGLSDFSIQSVHVNKPGQKGNPQKVPHSIKNYKGAIQSDDGDIVSNYSLIVFEQQ